MCFACLRKILLIISNSWAQNLQNSPVKLWALWWLASEGPFFNALPAHCSSCQSNPKHNLNPKNLANSSGSFPVAAGSAVRADVIEKAELYEMVTETNYNLFEKHGNFLVRNPSVIMMLQPR